MEPAAVDLTPKVQFVMFQRIRLWGTELEPDLVSEMVTARWRMHLSRTLLDR